MTNKNNKAQSRWLYAPRNYNIETSASRVNFIRLEHGHVLSTFFVRACLLGLVTLAPGAQGLLDECNDQKKTVDSDYPHIHHEYLI